MTRFPVVTSVGGMLETVAVLVEFEVASGNFRTFGFLVVDVLLLIMVFSMRRQNRSELATRDLDRYKASSISTTQRHLGLLLLIGRAIIVTSGQRTGKAH